MKPPESRNGMRRVSRPLAVLSLGLFLLLQGMAIVPAFHQLVHRDAGDKDHQCAVTLFTHGRALISPGDAAAPAASELVTFCAPTRPEIFHSVDVRFLPCRGPPACCL